MAPSRDFMVRQAVLNAAANLFPVSAQRGELVETLKKYGETMPTWLSFRSDVRNEYRALAARFAQ